MASDFKNDWLPLSKAALSTPYSAEYLSLLARKGKLPAKKIDNVWHTTLNHLGEYIKKQEARVEVKSGDNELLPLSRLASLTPYSAEYLSLLARKNKLPAHKVDNVWHTTKSSLDDYVKRQEAGPVKEYGPFDFFKKLQTVEVVAPKFNLKKVEDLLDIKEVETKGLFGRAIKTYSHLFPVALPATLEAPRASNPIFKQTVAFALLTILALNIGSSLYQNASGETFSSAVHESLENLAATSHVAAPLFSALDTGISFLVEGFNELKALALGQLAPIAKLLPAYRPPVAVQPRTNNLQPETKAVTQTSTPYNFESLRTDLKTELESYIRAQLSGIESPVSVYNNYSYNTTVLRENILLADTRPTVTRQSSSDVDHLSSALRRLTDGGTFVNTSASGAFSGTGSFSSLSFGLATGTSATTTDFFSADATFTNLFASSIDFTNLLFTNATGTNATTTNFFATTASSTNLFSTSGNIGLLTGGTGVMGTLLVNGSSTLQNFTAVNSTSTSATSTNFFSTNLTGTNINFSNILFTNATGTNATTTNFFTTTGSTTNLFFTTANGGTQTLSGTLTAANFLATGSSTLQNFTFVNATGTSATTTNFFSTTASSTNLFSTFLALGNYVDFREITAPSNPAANTLRLWAESSSGFGQLHFANSSGLDYQLGRDNIHTVRNTTGATITKGSWVYISGSTGVTPNVAKARADSVATMPVAGIMVADVANNAFGQMMTLGDVEGIDTSVFADGDVLYLSPTVAGTVTVTPPTGTNILQRVGVVIKSSAGAGIIAVLIGGEFNPGLTQTLTNKTLTSPTITGTGTYEFLRGTTTNATTTNFFSTTASSTNLFSSLLTVGGNGLVVDSSRNVGIGTTNPGATLHVNGSAIFGNSGVGGGGNLYSGATDVRFATWNRASTLYLGDVDNGFSNVRLRSGGADAMTILTSGNIGIGSTSPYAKLSVSGFTTGTPGIVADALSGFTGNLFDLKLASTTKFSVNQAGDVLLSGSTTLQNFTFVNATGTSATTTNFFSTTASSTNLLSSLLTVGGNGLVVDASRNVGIGATNPGYRLDVRGAGTGSLTAVAAFRDSSTNANELMIRTATGRVDLLATWEGTGIATDLSFTPTTAAGVQNEVMRVTSTGNVGIGTTNPVTAKLEVAVADNNFYSLFTNAAGTGRLSFSSDASGNPRIQARNNLDLYLTDDALNGIVVKNDGNIGIGSTSPYAKLSISGFTTGTPGIVADALSGFTGNLLDLKVASSTKFSVNQAGDVLLSGSTTLQNFTFVNATGTSATTTNFFSTTASSTNLFSTSLNTGSITSGLINGQTISSAASFTGTLTATGGLTTLSNLLLTGSSTLQNFTFQNATGTSATTTNFFSTTGSFGAVRTTGDIYIGGALTVAGSLTSSISNGQIQFLAIPQGTNIDQGTVYVNPTSAGTNNVLMGFAVSGTEKLRIDAEGDIQMIGTLNSTNTTGTNSLSGHLSVLGNTTLGNASSDTLTVTAGISSDIIPTTDNTYALGSTTKRWSAFHATTAFFDQIAVSSSTLAAFIINSDNATADTEDATLEFERGTSAPNAILKWNSTSDRFEFNDFPVYMANALTVAGTGNSSIAGLLSLTMTPAGTGLGQGSLYVNPTSASTDRTLVGVGVNGVERFRVDAEGDTTVQGSLGVENALYDISQDTLNINDDLQVSGNDIKDSSGTTRITLGTTNTVTGILAATGAITGASLDVGAGAITSGLINGQTISSAANFTGTLTATGGLTTLSNLLLTGSSTLQNFTFVNATGTSATTTNFFSTTASSTNLFSSLLTVGGNGLVVDASRNVGIGTTNPSTFTLQVAGSIGPNADNSTDLGSSALRVRSGYFGTSLSVGTSPANAGMVRIQNGAAINWSVVAGPTNYVGIGVDTSNILQLGSMGNTTPSGVAIDSAGSTSIVINEQGSDVDFRIESDTNANHFVSDAGTFSGAGTFGFGGLTSNTYFGINTPAITLPGAGNTFAQLQLSSGVLTVPTGSTGLLAGAIFNTPNFTNAGTNTGINATVYIGGSPSTSSGTNASLYIGGGKLINESGQIMVGTTTANNKLDIYSTTKSAIGFSGASGDTYKWTIGMDVSNAGRFSIASSTALGTTDRFVIDGNGNVGIGTTALGSGAGLSSAKLTVLESGTQASVSGAGLSVQSSTNINEATQSGGTIFTLNTYNANGAVMQQWQASGGTPNTQLSLYGTGSASAFQSRIWNTGAVGNLLLNPSGGNVGIGTANPDQLLRLVKDQNAVTYLHSTNNTAGTAAATAVLLSADSGDIAMKAFSGSFTTSGQNVADSGIIETSATLSGGLNISAAGTQQIGFWQNGSEKMRIHSTGNVGIGTTTPTWLLNPTSATAAQLALSSGAGEAQWAFRAAGNNLYFATTTVAGTATTSTSALTIIGSTGNVGIGTTNPLNLLSLRSSTIAGTSASIAVKQAGSADGIAAQALSNDAFTRIYNDGTLAVIESNYQSTAGYKPLTFWTSNAEKMRIDTAGNIGIGSTTPIAKLSIAAGTTGAVIMADAATGYSGNLLDLKVASSTKFSINQAGDIYSAGSTTLQNFTFVNATGTSATTTNFFSTTASSTNLFSSLLTVGGNGLVVDASRNVGIGTTNPGARLDVAGLVIATNAANTQFRAKYDSTRYADFGSRSNGDVQIYGYDGSGYRNILLGVDGSNIGGNVGIGTTTPTWLLNPTSATAAQLALSSGAGFGQWAFRNAGGNLYFATTTVAGTATTSTSALTIIGSSGNVGIGTTTPQSTLHTKGSGCISDANYSCTTTSGALSVQNVISWGAGNTSDIGTLTTVGGESAMIRSASGWHLDLAANANSTAHLRINTSGNVGIGSTSPIAKLSIAAGTTGAVIMADAATGYSGNLLDLKVASSTKFSINQAGDIYSAGSTTLQNFTFVNATGTSATTTNFFSTTASSTNLLSSLLAVGGTQGLNVISSGNVGIGTTTPQTKLTVVGDGTAGASQLNLWNGVQDARLTFSPNNGAQTAAITGGSNGSNAYMQFITDSTERMRINTSGNVGIGTTTPDNKLSIGGGDDTSMTITRNTLRTVMLGDTGSNNGGDLLLYDSTGTLNTTIRGGATTTFSTLGLTVGTSQFVVQQTSGNVGIGTTTPNSKLDVYTTINQGGVSVSGTSANLGLKLTNWGSGGRDWHLYSQSSGSGGGSGNFGVFDNTSSNWRMVIDSSGNVGIGTTTPYGKLSITSGSPGAGARAYTGYDDLIIENSGQSGITILNPDASDGNINFGSPTQQFIAGIRAGYNGGTEYLAFKVADAEYMRVIDSGNVGIGTTTPTWLLNPTSATAAQLALSSGAGFGQWAFRNAGGNLYFATTTVAGTATTSTSALTILGASGNVGIGTTNPSAILTVSNATVPKINLDVTAGGERSFLSYTEATSLTRLDSDGSIVLAANNAEVMRITNNIGIGSTSPIAKLSIAAGTTGAVIMADAATGYSGNLLDLKVASSTKFSINQAGDLYSAGSTTLQNFTFVNATGTSATTTNFFSTTASSTNLLSTSLNTGTITSGLINSQTISSAASFTGTLNVATGYQIGGAAAAGNILRGNGTNYISSTATFADTYGASTLLYSNGANTVQGLATANNGVLITSGTGVPSISSTLPTATQDNITRTGVLASGSIASGFGTIATGNSITTTALGTFGTLLANGSSTLQNFTFVNATGTSATTTNFFSTTASSTNLFATNLTLGTCTGCPSTSFANPSASVGLTAVNGSAVTAMRSDAAPALDVAIAPTWTGAHIFNNITRSTTTSATSTNFFSTTASSTNLFSTSLNTGSITSGLINSQTISSAANFTGTVGVTTSLTSPIIYGGSAAGSTLTLRTTSGVGVGADALVFAGGSNGANEFGRFTNLGFLGIGTTTPQWQAQLATSTRAQLTLSDPSVATFNHWSFRNAGGLFYLATSSASTFATSTTAALTINANGFLGIGSTTPSANLAAAGNIFVDNNGGTATSTFVGDVHITDMLQVGTGSSYLTTDRLSFGGSTASVINSSGKLQLKAGGTGTGSSGTGSIYFLSTTGTTEGRLETTSEAALLGTGTGNDGAIALSSGASTNCSTTAIASGRTSADCIATTITSVASAGNNSIALTSSTGYAAGDEVLIIQMTGTGVGTYEFVKISTVSSNTINLTSSLANTYAVTGAQVVRVPNYTNVTLTVSGTKIVVSAWDGTKYGVLAFRVSGTLSMAAGTSIDVSALGSAGGATKAGAAGGNKTTSAGGGSCNADSTDGTASSAGNAGASVTGTAATAGGAGGNGGGKNVGYQGGGGGGGTGGGGGGGAYATANNGSAGVSGAGGTGGHATNGGSGAAGTLGSGGTTFGTAGLTTMFVGGGGAGGANGAGGGGGQCYSGANLNGADGGAGGSGGAGGNGGGIVFIEVATINNSGTITAAGANGTSGGNGVAGTSSGAGSGGGSGGAGGGGGAGGSVFVKVSNTVTAMGTITASGGTAGSGGNGGQGGASVGVNAGYGNGGGGTGTTGGAAGANNDGNATAGANAAPGTGGAGGDGRIRCDTPSGSCSATPTANQNVYSATNLATANGYGTLYIGSVNTNSADLAEYYVTGDKTLEAGDLVCLSNTRVLDDGGEQIVNQGVLRRCLEKNDRRSIGVISTSPGVTLGSIDGETGNEDQRALALSGRVPVKISTENGSVAIGDHLTSSSIPGVAMKATGFANVIGISLGNFATSSAGTTREIAKGTATTTVKVGTVTVFVNLGQKKLDVNKTEEGKLVTEAENFDYDFSGFNLSQVKSLSSLSGKWALGEDGTASTTKLCIEKACIGEAQFEILLEIADAIFATSTDVSASSTASSTAQSAFGLTQFFEKLWGALIEKFASATNGITEFFANRVHTKELCVGDETGETCITKGQLDALLASAGIAASSTATSTATTTATTTETTFTPIVIEGTETASSTPATVEETASTTPPVVEEPAPEVEPTPAPEPTPEPAPVTEPAPASEPVATTQ